jgi:hypothetical protein
VAKKLDRLYIRVDAHFPRDEKYQALPYKLRDSAYLLFEALNGWSRDRRTDGYVPLITAQAIGREMEHPARKVTAFLGALAGAGLIELREDMIIILKYAKWQDTREDIAGRSEVRREAGRRGGTASGESKREASATGLLEERQSKREASASTRAKQNEAETETETETEVLSHSSKAHTPPTPPPGDVRSETRRDGPVLGPRAIELLQGFGELMGRPHSASEAIKAEEFCAELAYLSPAEMLDRMRQHLAWCREHRTHQPNSLAGYWSTLRTEKDHRRDAGAKLADTAPGIFGAPA